MDSLNILIGKIIPPNNHDHREGFTNNDIIQSLSENERQAVIDRLIVMLEDFHRDMLIVETLTLMRATEAIPIMRSNLKSCSLPILRLIIASCICQLESDESLVAEIIRCFHDLNDVNLMSVAFIYMAHVHNDTINRLIESYANNSNYLLAYNASRSLQL